MDNIVVVVRFLGLEVWWLYICCFRCDGFSQSFDIVIGEAGLVNIYLYNSIGQGSYNG